MSGYGVNNGWAFIGLILRPAQNETTHFASNWDPDKHKAVAIQIAGENFEDIVNINLEKDAATLNEAAA